MPFTMPIPKVKLHLFFKRSHHLNNLQPTTSTLELDWILGVIMTYCLSALPVRSRNLLLIKISPCPSSCPRPSSSSPLYLTFSSPSHPTTSSISPTTHHIYFRSTRIQPALRNISSTMSFSPMSKEKPGDFSHNNLAPADSSKGVLALFQNKGKVAIISGGGQGIGLEVAYALAESGANVAIW